MVKIERQDNRIRELTKRGSEEGCQIGLTPEDSKSFNSEEELKPKLKTSQLCHLFFNSEERG